MPRSLRPDVWLGSVAGLVSLAAPLHFDEAFWVSIASLITTHDRLLYETAIDNKSPLVYLISGLLDAAPGPFPLARAVLVGLLCFGLGAALCRLGVSVWVRVVAVAVAALASGLVLSIELPALVALAWSLVSLRNRHPVATVALIALASLVDPRSALVGAAIAVFLVLDLRGRAVPAAVSLVGVGITVIVAIVTNERLRYGLIELNLSSRGAFATPSPAEVVLTMVAVSLPVVGMIVLGRGLSTRGWVIAGASALVALASINPFRHYWVYLVLAVAFTQPIQRPAPIQVGLVVLATVPLVAAVVVDAIEQTDTLAHYRSAAERLADRLGEDDTFGQFALTPYAYYFTRADIALDAPGIHYLAWDTSLSDDQLSRLAAHLRTATVIIDDGGLSVPPGAVTADLVPVRSVFDDHLDRFDCSATYGTVTVRFAC